VQSLSRDGISSTKLLFLDEACIRFANEMASAPAWSFSCITTLETIHGVGMEKMFVGGEGSYDTIPDESIFAGPEPVQSRTIIASYRCKVYRTLLEQCAASHNIRGLVSLHSKDAQKQPS